jgi:hypothetical protein
MPAHYRASGARRDGPPGKVLCCSTTQAPAGEHPDPGGDIAFSHRSVLRDVEHDCAAERP